MAKISARGATEVARVNAMLPSSATGARHRYTFVLRSDRMILRKYAGERGYKAWRKLATTVPATNEGLVSILRPFGYEIEGDPEPPRRNECQWFARCKRTATVIVVHPIIGDVETCQPCVDKLGLEVDRAI